MSLPPIFPGDTYSLLSNNNLTQHVTVFVGLVVSGVLDTGLLEQKHHELIHLWPVLGGKLIKNTTPFSFTAGETVDFRARSLSSSLQDAIPAVGFDPTKPSQVRPVYHTISSSSDALFHFDAMSRINAPVDNLFALRVTTLTDGTLLGFRLPHHLVDGQSMYDVISAYCDLISGRAIPKLILPFDVTTPFSTLVQGNDVLPASCAKDAPYVHPSENYALGVMELLKYLGKALYASIASKVGLEDREEERYIHLSGEFVDEMRKDCQEELGRAGTAGQLEEGAGLELTRNDVITAWFLQCAYAQVPGDSGPLDLMYGFNYRPVLPSPSAGANYIHNSYYAIRTHFPSLVTFKTLPLSRIALAIRLCCIRNKQPSAVCASLAFLEENARAVIGPVPPGSRGDFLANVSAWTTFGYNSLDFSAALKGERGQAGAGKVVFTHPYVALPLGITAKPFAIVLKDGNGGYWLKANLCMAGWKGYEGC